VVRLRLTPVSDRRTMAKPKEEEESVEPVDMEMTPMIDVTFQLIVFFLLVMDFSSRDLKPLTLTTVKEAKQEDEKNPYTVTVNIAHRQDTGCPNFSMDKDSPKFHKVCRDPEHWIFYARGDEFPFTKKGREGLIRLLKTEAKQKMEGQYSEVPMIIRADARAPWGLVQRVMQASADPQVRIYKVKLAAKIKKPGQ